MALLNTLGRTAWTLAQFRPSRAKPDEVRRVQDRRLRQLLSFADEHSPFYRERFRGIDVKTAKLGDLPTTTKSEVMADFDRVLTDRSIRRDEVEDFLDHPANVGKLFKGKPVCHTSGSQGQPLILVQDWLSLDLLFAFQMTRGNVAYIRGGMTELFRRIFSPARLAVIVSRPGFYPSAVVWAHRPQSMNRFLDLGMFLGNDADLASKLRAFRPTALTATPTALDLLATQADPPDMPDLKQVVANSEMLTRAARDRIAAAFNAPVLDNYACGECLFLTNGCPTNTGAHVNADWAVLEIVDADNRPVPAGTLGAKILLTNLANYTQPLIRYEVGDLVAYSTEACECGSRLPRIDQIVGRSGDVFKVVCGRGEQTLAAYPFQHAFEHFRAIREWQAVQLGSNRILVRIEKVGGEPLDVESVKGRLHDRLNKAGFGSGLSVVFEFVNRLNADRKTGKFKRMIVDAESSKRASRDEAPLPRS
jgi:phenylacetate-CoA ligase